jgi:hypothetical protein
VSKRRTENSFETEKAVITRGKIFGTVSRTPRILGKPLSTLGQVYG